MYLAYYNLKKQPFHITPDPEFLYLSPSHKEALAAIIYGIEQRKGFVTITGAVGVGKTTILRSYLERADKKHLKIIYIFNARLAFEGLLKTVYHELGLPVEGNDVVEMVNRLYEVLIEEYKQGNIVVLVIDEAQNMPVDTLESLRMISNLETSKDKLIQIVLVGQPEFAEELNQDRLRQLKQRIAVRSTILPLTKGESLEYIRFRLRKAGCNPDSIFAPGALRGITKKAHGVPRILNVLGDNALITGFGYRQKPVTKKIVREIIGDFDGSRQPLFGRWWFRVALGVGALCVVGIALFLSGGPAVLGKIGMIAGRHEKGVPAHAVRESRPSGETVTKVDQARIAPSQAPFEPPSAKPKPPLNKKTVARGDNLSMLIKEVYGSSSAEAIRLVREGNPHITDPNVITVGSVITFPDPSPRVTAATPTHTHPERRSNE
jgi:general secretion pathway protein A